MNKTALAILAALSASIALADDLTTTDGTKYKHVTVNRVEADGIIITHSSGVAKIPFTELPKDVQERFGYGAAKVEAEKAAAGAAEEKHNAEVETAEEKRRAEQKAVEDKRIQEEKAAGRESAEKVREAEADLMRSQEQFETAEKRAAQSYSSSAKGSLSGQVFVSTKGGENFKLGAVQVSLFARNAIDTLVTGLKTYADAKIEQLRETLAAAKTAMEQAKATAEQAEAAERTFQDAYLKSIASNDYKEAERLADNAREDANKAREAADTASNEYSKIVREENTYYSAAFHFGHLRSPIQTAETDADGKFVIEVPRTGAFVIAVEGERSVGEQTERYYWLQPVSLEGRQQRVQNLSNTNLTRTTGTSSLILTAD